MKYDLRPLDTVRSIKVKLGLLVAVTITVASVLAVVGTRAGLSPWATVPVAVLAALGVTQLLARGMTSPLREMTAALFGEKWQVDISDAPAQPIAFSKSQPARPGDPRSADATCGRASSRMGTWSDVACPGCRLIQRWCAHAAWCSRTLPAADRCTRVWRRRRRQRRSCGRGSAPSSSVMRRTCSGHGTSVPGHRCSGWMRSSGGSGWKSTAEPAGGSSTPLGRSSSAPTTGGTDNLACCMSTAGSYAMRVGGPTSGPSRGSRPGSRRRGSERSRSLTGSGSTSLRKASDRFKSGAAGLEVAPPSSTAANVAASIRRPRSSSAQTLDATGWLQ